MSAFSVLGRQVVKRDYCYQSPSAALLEKPVHVSSVTWTLENTICSANSLMVGLHPGQYLIVGGLYTLEVLRGSCVVNNATEIQPGTAHNVVTRATESLPTLLAAESETPGTIPDSVLEKYAVVLKFSDLQLNLDQLGQFYPPLKGLYPAFPDYTFQINARSTISAGDPTAVFLSAPMLRAINEVCHGMAGGGGVAVYGVPSSGKATFLSAIANAYVAATGRAVAMLDLDPGSVYTRVPGTLALRVLEKPCFAYPHENSAVKTCYYGFPHVENLPDTYVDAVRSLLTYFREHHGLSKMPLLVKYPPWTKGYNRRVLLRLHGEIRPRLLFYMTHKGAFEVDGFSADEFEAADNVDLEILAGFGASATILRAVRRERLVAKAELVTASKLVYFHRKLDGSHDFSVPLTFRSPLTLAFSHVAAVSVFGYEPDHDTAWRHVDSLLDATIVGVFTEAGAGAVPPDLPFCLSKTVFAQLRLDFVGLCIVHSTDCAREVINVYVGDEGDVGGVLLDALGSGRRVVLARGEGEVPAVEFSGYLGPVPYANFAPPPRVGGVRRFRNLGRKSQQ